MPFFRLINPFLCFYRWFLRQNGVYMQKVPWFFKLKLCRGPGPAGVSHRNTETGTHTHTSHHHHWRLCCKINLRILGTHCRHVSNVMFDYLQTCKQCRGQVAYFITVHCSMQSTPCLAGPQPQGSYQWKGPIPGMFIHTVECKNVGPGNYWRQNLAQFQIFEVKFANT